MKKPKKPTKQERQMLLETAEILMNIGRKEWDKNEIVRRDKVGRPTVVTPEALLKLKQAFLIGCPDREACIYAGISESTFYKFCKENPEFSEEKERLKEAPVLASRLNIARALEEGDIETSWKLLKSKRKDEFAEKQIVENHHILTPQELEEQNKIE